MRETQTDIRQSEIRLDQIKSTDIWLDAIPNIKFDFDKINKFGDMKKRDWLTQHVEGIDVRYDQKLKKHDLSIRIKVPVNDPEMLVAGNTNNAKNQPKNILNVIPR